MKTSLLLLLTLVALRADPVPVIGHPDSPLRGQKVALILADSTRREGTISRVNPDSLELITAEGGCRVPLAALLPADQKRFGYDLAQAAALEAKRKAEIEAEIERQNQASVDRAASRAEFNLKQQSKSQADSEAAERTEQLRIRAAQTQLQDKTLVAHTKNGGDASYLDAVYARAQSDLQAIETLRGIELSHALAPADRDAINWKYNAAREAVNQKVQNTRSIVALRGGGNSWGRANSAHY